MFKVIHVLEGLQQAKHLRMLNVYRLYVINKDQQLTIRELSTDLGIAKTIVSEILTWDLGMKRVMAKFIPQLLLLQQKAHRAAAGRTV